MAATSDSIKGVRVNKYLAERGFCSRREADKLIDDGLVKINGKVASLGSQVFAGDVVSVKGKDLAQDRKEPIFLLYNKPIGVECTMDPKVENSLGQVVDYPERIFMIGRLDKMSEGLLILTNYGEAVNKILRSENEKEKEYIVYLTKDISDEDILRLRKGMWLEIGGEKIRTKECTVERIRRDCIRIILTEGKNRQIRRMLEQVDHKIKRLKRVRVMNFELEDLEPGEYRELSGSEVRNLLRQLGLN